MEKVIKGEMMSQILCNKKICMGSEAEKVPPKHLCAWTKHVPLLFKAAVPGLEVLMRSTHSPSVARVCQTSWGHNAVITAELVGISTRQGEFALGQNSCGHDRLG